MNLRGLSIEVLPGTYAVAQLESNAVVPDWARRSFFASLTRTPQEFSIVCEDALVPHDVRAERGFRCLRVVGPISFTETGILQSLADPLARAGISIFAISTYNTDYLLLPSDDLGAAISALSDAGHSVGSIAS